MTTTPGKACPDWMTEQVPYEAELDRRTPGRCGAAALCMVLRSFGLESVQPEICRALEADKQMGARTHRLAQYALRRGLHALVLQARDPWAALQQGCDPELRIIIHHRVALIGGSGHFSILVGMTANEVFVHDPARGPRRRLSRATLEMLWRPQHDSPIPGHVLVAFGLPSTSRSTCDVCGTELPRAVSCPQCRAAVGLQPGAMLGCARRECPSSVWNALFCPDCDAAVLLDARTE